MYDNNGNICGLNLQDGLAPLYWINDPLIMP